MLDPLEGVLILILSLSATISGVSSAGSSKHLFSSLIASSILSISLSTKSSIEIMMYSMILTITSYFCIFCANCEAGNAENGFGASNTNKVLEMSMIAVVTSANFLRSVVLLSIIKSTSCCCSSLIRAVSKLKGGFRYFAC